MDLCKQSFESSKINFDLTEGGNNCGFTYEKDMSIRSYQENEFTRCVGFSSEVERFEVL